MERQEWSLTDVACHRLARIVPEGVRRASRGARMVHRSTSTPLHRWERVDCVFAHPLIATSTWRERNTPSTPSSERSLDTGAARRPDTPPHSVPLLVERKMGVGRNRTPQTPHSDGPHGRGVGGGWCGEWGSACSAAPQHDVGLPCEGLGGGLLRRVPWLAA